jgi:hypothetical protein
MSQAQETTMINEVLTEATLNQSTVITKRKYNKKKKVMLVEEPALVEPEVEEVVVVEEPVAVEVVEAQVEVVAVVVYDSDDDDEEELLRLQEVVRLKLEKKKLKKLQENKAEEWEQRKAPLIIDAIHNDMTRIVEFVKKNNIPLTLLSMGEDLMRINAGVAYQLYDQEQLDSDYSKVKDNFFTPPRTNVVKKKTTARKPTMGTTDYIPPVRVTDGTRDPRNIMVSGEELRFKHRGEYFQFAYTGSNEFLYKGETYTGLNKAVVSIQALENMGYKKNAWNVWDHVEIYRQGTWISVKKLPLL